MARPDGEEPRLRDELVSLARIRLVFAVTIFFDALLFAVVVPILAAVEWLRRAFHLHGLNELFVVVTEGLLAVGTLATIGLYVVFDIRIAYRRFRDAERGGHHE